MASHVRSRSGHGSTLRSRTTHEYNGFLGPITGASEVYEQIAIDGVYGQQNLMPGSVGYPQLQDRALTLSKFTQAIRPVVIVDILPALPNTDYPLNSFVAYSVDGKLYKNIAGAWTKAVDGADIAADSITAAQIAAGAINVSELAAGAVTADKIAAGAVTASKIDIRDEFGAVALNGSGFAGTWLGFLNSGLIYNSSFSVGLTGTNFAVSQVGTGSTIADYEASKSSQLPYWVISSSQSATFNLLYAPSYSNDSYLRSNGLGGTIDSWYQDVPLDLSTEYPTVYWREELIPAATPGSTVERIVALSYRDVNHVMLTAEWASVVDTRENGDGKPSISANKVQSHTFTAGGLAPTMAVYLRIRFQIRHTGLATTYYILDSVSTKNVQSPYIKYWTPTMLSASVNDWNPGVTMYHGLTIRATTNANQPGIYITGIIAATEGTVILLYNWGQYDLHLKQDSVLSLAANRLWLPGAQDLTMRPGDSVQLVYTSSNWRSTSPNTGPSSFIQNHTPTQLTGSVNNWDPATIYSGLVLRATTDTNSPGRSVSGLLARAEHTSFLFYNWGQFDLHLLHESSASLTANRFALPGLRNLTLKPGDSAYMVYLSDRWRVISPSTYVIEDWIAPTFLNSWVNYDSGHAPAGYSKDSAGVVRLRGLIKNGTIGLSAFTLPVGYRPEYPSHQLGASADAYGVIYIDTGGNVVPRLPCSNSWVDLSLLQFRAYY